MAITPANNNMTHHNEKDKDIALVMQAFIKIAVIAASPDKQTKLNESATKLNNTIEKWFNPSN